MVLRGQWNKASLLLHHTHTDGECGKNDEALSGSDGERMEKDGTFLQGSYDCLGFSLSNVTKDSVFHIAVHSRNVELLKDLLKINA